VGFSLGIAKPRLIPEDSADVVVEPEEMRCDVAIHDDPYFSGGIGEKPGRQVAGPPPVLAWIGVCAANVILPIYFGMMMTRDGARVGMLIGIIVVFALGYHICFVSRKAMLTVVYGGWIVAALQFLPFLQLVAGSIGTSVAQVTGQATSGDFGQVNTVLGGFLATMATGGILIAFAAAFGLLNRALTRK
jgi:hypothetical protein